MADVYKRQVLEEISRLIEPLDRLTDCIGRVFDEHGEVKDSASPRPVSYTHLNYAYGNREQGKLLLRGECSRRDTDLKAAA